eukprot:314793-Amphidinium_carterae.1
MIEVTIQHDNMPLSLVLHTWTFVTLDFGQGTDLHLHSSYVKTFGTLDFSRGTDAHLDCPNFHCLGLGLSKLDGVSHLWQRWNGKGSISDALAKGTGKGKGRQEEKHSVTECVASSMLYHANQAHHWRKFSTYL